MAGLIGHFEEILAQSLGRQASADVRLHADPRRLAWDTFTKVFPPLHVLARSGVSEHGRWPHVVRLLKDRNVSVSRELTALMDQSPQLVAAIPAYPRHQNQLVDRLARAVDEGSEPRLGRVLTARGLAAELLEEADRRFAIPTYVRNALTRDEIVLGLDVGQVRIVYGVLKSRTGLVWADTTSARVLWQDRVWPEHDVRDPNEQQGAAAFRLFMAMRAASVEPNQVPSEQACVSLTHRATRAHLPLVDGPMPAEELAALSLHMRHERTLLGAVRALVQVRSGREHRNHMSVWSRRSSPKFVDAGKKEWMEFLRRVQSEGVAEYGGFVAGLLATLPEAGLEPADANLLLDELRLADDEAFSKALAQAMALRKRSLPAREGSLLRGTPSPWLEPDHDGHRDVNGEYRSLHWFQSAAVEDSPRRVQAFRDMVPHEPIELGQTPWPDGESGLRRYFTFTRVDRILGARSLGGEARAHSIALEQSLATLPKGRGAQFRQLRVMWLAVGTPGTVVFEPAAVRVKVGGGVAARIIGPPKMFQTPTRTVSFSRLAIATTEPNLNPVQATLMAILRDVEADHLGVNQLPSLSDAGAIVDGLARVVWPMPSYPAPYDQELVVGAWNAAVEGWSSAEEMPDQDIIDNLAVELVRSVTTIARARKPPEFRPDFRSVDTQLAELRKTLHNNPVAGGKARIAAHTHFLHVGLGLLCFPEFGLSHRTANLLFSLIDPKPSVLRKARMKRFNSQARMRLVDRNHREWNAVRSLE